MVLYTSIYSLILLFPVYSKIENNELLNPVLVDQLIDEAKQLEQRLLNQKEQLKHKLGILSSLLTANNN